MRADFPCLQQTIHGRPLVFLDTAASAQKPAVVIDAMARVLREDYANIHRGVYDLSQRATELHEGARATAQRFINAADGARDRVHAQRHRGHQSGGAEFRRGRASDRAIRC